MPPGAAFRFTICQRSRNAVYRIDPPVYARLCTNYEPTLQPDETRDEYLERFRRVNRPAWSFLTPEEWAQIDQHVTTCDLPETAKTWLTLGREAGFANVMQLFLDPTGFYGLYRYDV